MISNVWVDGNWVGTTPVTVTVDNGYHTVQVDTNLWDTYWNTWTSFQEMIDSNSNGYWNPASILVTSDLTVTAYYS